MATRVQKKQINNNKIGQMFVSGFVAAGESDIATSVLVTAAINDKVTVIPSTGTENSLGFLVTNPLNKVKIVNNTTKSLIGDINSNEVFSRLTEAAGVYTLSYFSIQNGTETSVTLNQTIIFFPEYNYEFKDFPFDSPLRLLDNIINVVAVAPSASIITDDITINQIEDIKEIDLSLKNITITLGDISLGSITKNKRMLFKIKINNGFAATFKSLSGNDFEDEDIQIGNDPLLGVLEVYADNNNIWGTTEGLDRQQAYYSSLSTGMIKIGADSDNPANNITINDNINSVATRISATEVNFQVTNHAQFGTAIGKYIRSSGYIPAAYDIIGVILSLPDANNIRVTPLSDPGINASTNGVLDFGSLNVVFGGLFRIVDRVSETNGAPTTNQFSKSRSRVFKWVAKSNIDHSTISDGTLLVIVAEGGVISVDLSADGSPALPVFDDVGPNLNTHYQLANFVKTAEVVSNLESSSNTENNPFNRIINLARTLGVIKAKSNPPVISAISGTIGIDTTAGNYFTGTNAGYRFTNGLNPNQLIITASSPTLIITVDRAGEGNIVNISNILNVNEVELSPGIFSAKGASKSSLNTIVQFPGFNGELLGQEIFSGGTRLQDAIDKNENINLPNLVIFGGVGSRIAIDNAATDLDLAAEAIFNNSPAQFDKP